MFDKESKDTAVKKGQGLTKGINAGPGAATGKIDFHADDAEQIKLKDPKRQARARASRNLAGRYSRHAGSAWDLDRTGWHVITRRPVSRQMGKVCVVGCSDLDIEYKKGTVTVGTRVLKEERRHLDRRLHR